jgi:hypothetical protein
VSTKLKGKPTSRNMPRFLPHTRRFIFAAAALLTLMSGVRAEVAAATDETDFFEATIRPVLAVHCYECHNSRDNAEGELALDYRDGLLQGGISGPAIVPGKPAESLLLKVMRHEIEGQEMPDGGPKLDDRVIADFEKWIAGGAPDPRTAPPTDAELAAATSWAAVRDRRKQWWSFQPLQPHAPPAVLNENWSAHPIDRFVLAKLEEHSLQPNPPADAATLVRRLYFTLTGLPPTPAEFEEWSTRLSPDGASKPDGAAVEQLVDRLLASPQFGERWARHWMDWIRYAESHGSEGDPEIVGAAHYRDYLIRALNADVPYDQLVREHVAGDLLNEPRIDAAKGINESVIGTAHWRMVFHGFAPTDALDEKVRFTDDQINAFSKAFLGLTVSCARCHDHKFDPISQADYYALFGILGSCRPGRTVIDSQEQQDVNRQELAALKPQIRAALAADWLKQLPRLAEQLLRDDGPWTQAEKPNFVLHPWYQLRNDAGAASDFAAAWQRRLNVWQDDVQQRSAFRRQPGVVRWNLADAADRAQWFGYGNGLPQRPSAAGEYAVEPSGDKVLTGIYPAGVYSHGHSTKHAARLTSPDIPLDGEYDLYLQVVGAGQSATRYVVQNYPRNGTVYPVAELPDDWAWQRFDLSYWNGDPVHIELATARDAPLLVKDADRSWFGIREATLVKKGAVAPPKASHGFLDPLFQWYGSASHDKANAPGAPDSFPALADGYVRAIGAAIAAWRDGTLDDAQALLLDRCVRQGLLANQLSSLPAARPLVEKYRVLEAEIPAPTRVPSLDEWTPHDQRLFTRGDHKSPAEVVPRRFLEVIDATPYETADSGRLRLAEDLLRPDNPLPRRVIVNRVWHHLFGGGLVNTPDNFGRMGSTPTHPELLDYLAVRVAPLESERADSAAPPDFDWSLKRMIRFIVTSQTWQLSAQPSPQARQTDPDNRLLSHAHIKRLEAESIRDSLLAVAGQLDRAMFGDSVSDNAPRRSLYLRVRRNSLNPLLRVFDFPEPFSTTGRRDVTNVPAQSLTLLNDPAIERLATAWAKRVWEDELLADDEQRVQSMFISAFGRTAQPAEIERAKEYLASVQQQHQILAGRANELRRQIDQHKQAESKLLEPARQRLLAELSHGADSTSLPQPMARWEFDEDFRDVIGAAHGVSNGNARLEEGALVVDGRGAHVVSAPLDRPLRAKTLEAWVELDNLDQRGGGVMSVQTPDGVTFDAIVIGEKNPRQWLAGSNNFARSQSFDAPLEDEAASRPVHLAIAYHQDGRIVGYRDGQPYGHAYQSRGPAEFAAANAVVSFGVRHLPAVGNRLLAGRILQAQLYDRALSDEEVLASSTSTGQFVSEAKLLAALSPDQRAQLERQRSNVQQLEAQLERISLGQPTAGPQSAWKDLARAMFCFKEFIYVE